MERQRVVLVDDDLAVLSALARVLRGESCDVVPTRDPQEALDWLRTRDVAVLVVDDRMPVLSGTSLCQLSKIQSPATARILLTGYAGDEIVPHARDEGLFQLFAKPWDDEEFRRVIRERLREHELGRLGSKPPLSD